MPNQTDSEPSLSVLRIYLRRRSTKPAPGLWGRIIARALSNELAARALKAGVSYATVPLGHAGFVSGARRLVTDAVLLRLDGTKVSLRGVPT